MIKKTHKTYHYVSDDDDDDDEDDNAWPYCQNSHVNLELLTNKTRIFFETNKEHYSNKRKLDFIKTSKLLNPLSRRDSEAGDTQQLYLYNSQVCEIFMKTQVL